MKIIYLTIGCLLFVSSRAQNLDTITSNYSKPAILDILSDRPVLESKVRPTENPPQVEATTPKKRNNIRRKVITEKAAEDKSVLIRALSAFAPRDQFNVSAFKELTYEISDYTSQNIKLPGVLGERVQNGNGTVELVSVKTLVRLEIDTTAIEGDIDFFERLVYNTLDLNLTEDEVTVKIWEFPYAAAQKAKKTKLIKDGNKSESEVLDEKIVQTIPWYSLWWIWLLVAVFLSTIVLLIIFKRRKRVKKEEDLQMDNADLKKMSLSALDKAPVSLKKAEFKKLLIEAPESVALFMENIVETQQEEALTIFSILAKPYLDLIGQLKPHMSYSTYLILLNKIDEDIEEKIDPDSQDKFLLTFNNTVKALSNEQNSIDKTPDHKVFGFISQLNDIQIFKLIEKDKPELSSVLFAQLPNERKLKVMELLDEVERGEMLLKLTDMSRLPLSVIREIGQRYAKKAKGMAGLYNIDIDGIGAIINTLDELDENKQKEILEIMLQNDLNKGQIVESKFIGFFNIHKLESSILQNAFMDLETETLLNALFGADEKIIEAVLNTRPPREGEMIKSELESGRIVSNSARSIARKEMLSNIRKYV
ncbi:MAG: hypothetical protein O3B34_00950 [Bacteroidetes bacterium]|nr:hypothetical protein [Bacteroidota bacterium]